MVKTVIDKKEKDNLQILFEAFDENKDGVLSLKEMVYAYKSKFGILVPEGEIARVIRQVDLKGDRELTFTEFVMGACSKPTILTDINLKIAFMWIDTDHDNFITRADLKEFIGVQVDTYIGIMIEEADDDCDGGLN